MARSRVFIVSNPPFLGGKLLRARLSDQYVDSLFVIYEGGLPAESDLVCHWFAKAREALRAGRAKRVGLVATNSIRGGGNRQLLDPIARVGSIFEAVGDERWAIDGAAVRVSLVCFGAHANGVSLNGIRVPAIHADLSAEASNLIAALRQPENLGVSFMGDTKGGAFDIDGGLARIWLVEPLNPNARLLALNLQRAPQGKAAPLARPLRFA